MKNRILALAAAGLLFLSLSCQENSKGIEQVGMPKPVKQKIDELQLKRPGNEFVVVLMNDEGRATYQTQLQNRKDLVGQTTVHLFRNDNYLDEYRIIEFGARNVNP